MGNQRVRTPYWLCVPPSCPGKIPGSFSEGGTGQRSLGHFLFMGLEGQVEGTSVWASGPDLGVRVSWRDTDGTSRPWETPMAQLFLVGFCIPPTLAPNPNSKCRLAQGGACPWLSIPGLTSFCSKAPASSPSGGLGPFPQSPCLMAPAPSTSISAPSSHPPLPQSPSHPYPTHAPHFPHLLPPLHHNPSHLYPYSPVAALPLPPFSCSGCRLPKQISSHSFIHSFRDGK